MSQATELLNSLAVDDIATYSANAETEAHIVIGDDRFITVPNSLKRIAVQHDHNVETVTFDCPRYWDNLDMSQMIVYINAMLPNGDPYCYIADNVRADGDIMHFDWTILNTVTQYKGNITFLVCVKKTDDTGNEVNHWNSELNRDMYISEGMECQETTIAEEYPDIITQLLLRMSSVEQINIKADEMQTLYENTQAVAATAEEVKNEALDASNYIKNSYANAIKGEASGEIVRVDDVSPIEHAVKVNVHGKNRWTTDLTYPINNIEYDSETQIYTFSGPTNTTLYTLPIPIPKGTICTITAEILSGNVTSGGDGGIAFGGYHKDDAGVSSWQGYINIPKMTNTDISGEVYTHTVEITEDVTHFYAFIYAATATIHEPLQMRIQYEVGSVATELTPYIDPSTVTLKRLGKSVFAAKEYTLEASSAYAWSSILMAKIKVPPGKYVASCKFKQSGSDKSRVALSMREYGNAAKTLKHTDSRSNTGSMSAQFDVTGDNEGFEMYLYSNYSADALTTKCLFYDIYVELSDAATGFEAYNGSVVTPSTDGTCTVSSVSPTMTIFTDTPGVTVECEYNRDTTKAMTSYIFTDEIKEEIASKVEDDMAEVLAALNGYAESVIGGDS